MEYFIEGIFSSAIRLIAKVWDKSDFKKISERNNEVLEILSIKNNIWHKENVIRRVETVFIQITSSFNNQELSNLQMYLTPKTKVETLLKYNFKKYTIENINFITIDEETESFLIKIYGDLQDENTNNEADVYEKYNSVKFIEYWEFQKIGDNFYLDKIFEPDEVDLKSIYYKMFYSKYKVKAKNLLTDLSTVNGFKSLIENNDDAQTSFNIYNSSLKSGIYHNITLREVTINNEYYSIVAFSTKDTINHETIKSLIIQANRLTEKTIYNESQAFVKLDQWRNFGNNEISNIAHKYQNIIVYAIKNDIKTKYPLVIFATKASKTYIYPIPIKC